MNIDLHNNDDLYRKAHERLEEEPSAEVWDKVMAKLDSRDARYYQQKSIRWKRTSLLLLLLLGTMLISGVMYIATKEEVPQLTSINKNDKNKTPDNTTLQQPVSNDSNSLNQNINQRNVYATKQSRKSDSNTSASILQPAATEQLDQVSKQNNARFGKQYSQPVQDTSIGKKETTVLPVSSTKDIATQLTSSAKKDSYLKNKTAQQQVAAQKPTVTPNKEKTLDKQNSTATKQKNTVASTGKEETIYSANSALIKQSNITASTSKKKYSYNRSNQEASAYQLSSIEYENNVLFPLQSLNLNSFSPYPFSRKEAVDSTTSAQAEAMASTLKKGNLREDIAAGSNKKTVRIAQPLKNRLQMTGYASLDFSEYHLDDDNEHDNNQQPPSQREDRHKIGDRENHGFSFSAGITARYQATKEFSIKSGLGYSNTTININPQTLYAAQDGNQGVAYKFVTSSGYAYVKPSNGTNISVGDSAKAGLSQHELQFLSIPAMVGYTAFTNNRFSVIPSFGAAANFLLGTQVKTEINEASAKESVIITKLDGLQSWYPSLLADVEIQYHFKKNMSLTFLPSFRYAVRPLTQNNAVKTSPYNFGLGLGFTYHF